MSSKTTETMRVHQDVKMFLKVKNIYPESLGETLARLLGIALGGNQNGNKKETKKR